MPLSDLGFHIGTCSDCPMFTWANGGFDQYCNFQYVDGYPMAVSGDRIPPANCPIREGKHLKLTVQPLGG